MGYSQLTSNMYVLVLLSAYQNNPRLPRSRLGSHTGHVHVANALWPAALHQPNRHAQPVGQAPPGSGLSPRLQVLPTTVARQGVPGRHGLCRSLRHDVGGGSGPGWRTEGSEGSGLKSDLNIRYTTILLNLSSLFACDLTRTPLIHPVCIKHAFEWQSGKVEVY